ncbi:MAG: transposase [Chloroflexi bacterium]|nr:transposase [Chloroflexota bacterium]
MKSKFDPKQHHRRSIRLKGYDYAQAGAYYVTIVTWHRECLFGEVVDGEMILSPYGEIVQKWWNEIQNHFPIVETDAFVVMPNHVYGIIVITERRGAVLAPRGNPNLKTLETPESENKFMEQRKFIKEDDSINQSISQNQGGETPPLRAPTLGQIVAYFKYQSTKEMNAVSSTGVITKFWQRNYYEHIIRNEQGLKNKTDYIEANPMLWDEDDMNPINAKL